MWEQRGAGYRVHHSCPPQGEGDERCEECGGELVPTLMGIFCENSPAYRDLAKS